MSAKPPTSPEIVKLASQMRGAHHAERKCAKHLEKVRAKKNAALHPIHDFHSVTEEIKIAEEERTRRQVQSYISGTTFDTSDLDALVKDNVQKLDALRSDAAVATNALPAIENALDAAEKALLKAKQNTKAFEIEWAKARQLSSLEAFMGLFNQLPALIAEIAAAEQHLPPPKYYPMLQLAEKSVSDRLLDSMKRIDFERLIELRDFPNWLDANSTKMLPGFSDAAKALDQELQRIINEESIL